MIGRNLAHYKILEKIGAGGMGEVYRARDNKLSREVAIKILPTELAQDPERRERFEREASVIAALKHPNIVTIHSLEEDGGIHFITMELVEGRTLAEAIPGDGLPLDTILEVALPLVDAVCSAHAKGITHRDLKPANVMLGTDGRVKVLDFGLAKFSETDADLDKTVASDAQTRAEQVLGTLAYMSPEQAEGRPVDHRSDIFSLGIVLYQMATGEHPFQGPTTLSTLSAILKDQPSSIVEHKRSLPSDLAAVVECCLAKSPTDRFQTAADLRESLQEIQAKVAAEQVGATRPTSLLATLRRPVYAVPVVVVVIALIAIAGWLYQRSAKKRWARQVALPEVERLLDATPWTGGPGMWQAYQLGQEAQRYIPDDPLLNRLSRRYSRPVTIHTDPPGALVYAKPYAVLEDEWELLGETPIDTLSFVSGVLRVKIEKAGYETVDDLYWNPLFVCDERGYVLREAGSIPAGMVWVSATGPRLHIEAAPAGIHMPGIEHLPPQELGDFFMDRHEVTNREYKRFVDAGGYTDPRFWQLPFSEEGRELDWQEAMARFVDRTQQPGPATWEVGDYPDGEGDFPVSGISWFEAAAYAQFVGKSLPTIYHWDRVALTWASPDIVPQSNLTGSGPVAVGTLPGANRYGTSDLAGNVREWCVNASSRGGRFILGGGWNDPAYGFVDAFAQSPWDRAPTNGFRCIQLVETSAVQDQLTSTSDLPVRDFMNEPPVTDETFALFLNQFRYDNTALNDVVEEVREEEDYIREKITFDAAYGDERMMAYLFLPRTGSPPYQTVVMFPGSGAIHTRSSDSLSPGSSLFILKSGRALLYPVYKSTYERGDGLVSDYPDETSNWKDHIVMWGKDLKRSLDYLETREDIASEQLAYLGLSWGAAMGPIMMAIESRLKAGVVVVAGLNFQHALPEVDEVHYIQRVKIPVLMLNGRYDFFFPYETSQVPYFELLATPAEHKKLVVHETGHAFPRTERARETLAWLDKYLGPVR